MKPPKGEPWCWLTRELLSSDAWKAQSIHCRRLTDFLLIEHMNHAGTENGRLKATYDQLQTFGIRREKIRYAIDEAEALGLIRVQRGCYRGGTSFPSLFTITYLPADGAEATNEWKGRNRQNLIKADKSGLKKLNPQSPMPVLKPVPTGRTGRPRARKQKT